MAHVDKEEAIEIECVNREQKRLALGRLNATIADGKDSGCSDNELQEASCINVTK